MDAHKCYRRDALDMPQHDFKASITACKIHSPRDSAVSEQLTTRSSTGPSQKMAPPPPPTALFPANRDWVSVIMEQLGMVLR